MIPITVPALSCPSFPAEILRHGAVQTRINTGDTGSSLSQSQSVPAMQQ
jgi:hypothetical protein